MKTCGDELVEYITCNEIDSITFAEYLYTKQNNETGYGEVRVYKMETGRHIGQYSKDRYEGDLVEEFITEL